MYRSTDIVAKNEVYNMCVRAKGEINIMLDKSFYNVLKKIAVHNGDAYEGVKESFTATECNKVQRWTPADLIAREYLNNGGGSSRGFLGIQKATCLKWYDYMCDHKQELIDNDLINKEAWNNAGFTLWTNYDFDR